tara:strand:+ start:824 stop:1063 length:240 start_codon:yes stop_codon:yes gene_type:complete
MTDTTPAFHHTNRRPIFQPSERKILQNFINSQTRACEAQEKLIEVIKQELADSKQRCWEHASRCKQLEERDYINKGEVE